MNREEKSAAIEEIAAQIEGAEAIFAVDYRGISVSQAAELRAKLREADASFRVVKNRLTKLAADKAGEERLAGLLEGPTALTFVRGDTAGAAKAISTFNKEHDVLAFKGGFMDELLLDEDSFRSIARLPARQVLDGQLAGIVASPLTGLVRGLGSMISGLALQLGQIAEKGLVSGEAPKEDSSDAQSAGPVAEEDSSSSQAVGEDSPSTPPADEESEGPPEEAPAEEAEGAETPTDEETPADPGSEAEESAADGEAESPSEEESQSDSSTTSEGDASPEASEDDPSDDSETSETDPEKEE
jgi:large subunit ribosomal protein L10